MDRCRLGALVSMCRIAASRDGKLRSLGPQLSVEQSLELTRMRRMLEMIIK
jgi:anti-anti-sigma regulatory factor